MKICGFAICGLAHIRNLRICDLRTLTTMFACPPLLFGWIAGGLAQTGHMARGVDSDTKTKVERDIRRGLDILIKNDVDLIICEVSSLQERNKNQRQLLKYQ
jgi:hypothetical protein